MERDLVAARSVRSTRAQVARCIDRGIPRLLPSALTADAAGVAELAVELPGGGRVVQEVVVTVRPVPTLEPVQAWSVRWAPQEHSHLLPAFIGELTVEDDDDDGALVRLSGRYRLPLGLVGAAGDALGGRRLARASLQGFLDAIAEGIDQHRDNVVSLGAAEHARDLRPNAPRATTT